MADKKISQLPLGVLTPNSILPLISNGATSQIIFNEVLIPVIANDIYVTASTYNQIGGITSFYLNNGNSFNIDGYFTGYTFTPEDTGNKQNNMNVDGGGVKYPTVDTVNELTNNIVLATINTGFIDPNDTFFMSMFDVNNLNFNPSSKGIIFKSLLETPPFAPSSAIKQIPTMLIPLSGFGLTIDGIYVIFIGYTDSEEIVLSNNNFNNSTDVAQLGILILKVIGGETTFLDITRNVINKPNIANYSNLEKTILGLKSNVIVIPNSGTTTISNTSGSIKGISVNWQGTNNDEKLIVSGNPTSFTHLSYANALTTTPPTFSTTVTTDQYWNGSALVNLSASGSATVQRWIVTINGNLALQYGEQEYVDLDTAKDNIGVASFIDVIPKDTYAEIARMAAIRDITDLGDNQQVVFRSVTGVGSGGDTNETFWGEITGNVNDQRDLFTKFEQFPNIGFVDLGNTQLPITNINLNLGKNLKVNITGDTYFNFIPSTEGAESDLILKIPSATVTNLQFSPNVIWDNNVIPTINNTNIGLDNTFNVGTGPNSGIVYNVLQQPDTKIVIGGSFTQYQTITANRITRLNLDGIKDSTFNYGTGFDNAVVALSLQPSDNKILCGGFFTTFNGTSANRIARLNTNGSIDSSLNIGTGFDSTVNAIVIQTGDSKILVGGGFSGYNGTLQNRITRLNTNGTIDSSFIIGSGFNGTVQTMIQSGTSNIVCGGDFTSYSGTLANRLARLNADGSIDNTFNASFDATVQTLSLQSDGQLLVGGAFTKYGSVGAGFFGKINSDGTPDTSFNIGIGFGFVSANVALEQPDGKVLVGGRFNTFTGSTQNFFIRLNPDGTKDSSFNIGSGFNDRTLSIVIPSGTSKIIIGGEYTVFTGATQRFLVRLNSDGSKDTSFNYVTGFSTNITVVKEQSDGKLLVGGQFTTFTGSTQKYLIRLSADGIKDSTFNIGTGFNDFVYDIVIQNDGKILCGGNFITYQGVSYPHIIRLNTDGTIDTSFSAGTGFNANASFSLQTDGKIVCAGSFTTYQGVTANKMIRLNTDGTIDNTFSSGSGFDGTPGTPYIQLDGKIICTGSFTTYQGVPAIRIIRLNADGSRDNTFNAVPGFNNTTVHIAPSSGETKYFLSGTFTSYGGVALPSLARLNPNGSIDNSFNVGTGFNATIRTILQQPSGKIIVGGDFTQFSGVNINRLIRLNSNGSIDNSFSIGTGANNPIYKLTQQLDSKILVGGQFTTFNGVTKNRLLRLNTNIEIDYYFKLLQDGPNIIIK